MKGARYLVVGAETADRAEVAARLREIGEVRLAHSPRATRELLGKDSDWDGIVVLKDSLPPGKIEGYAEVLDAIRTTGCTVPALVLSATNDAEVARRTFAAGGLPLTMPIDRELLEVYTGLARRARSVDGARIDRIIHTLRETHTLSEREVEILRLVTTGIPRAQLAYWLPIKESSIKTHVRGLLRKCRCQSVGELAAHIQRVVHHGDRRTPYRTS